ncbi:hypothetical protein ACIPWE_35525 [Streptomyces sp. NPDC090073]|uniref:hypothetical protein n=1 Tax=Streptomyces sp. NPDC090073 TaxID=3365936 RepID=UPI0037F55072
MPQVSSAPLADTQSPRARSPRRLATRAMPKELARLHRDSSLRPLLRESDTTVIAAVREGRIRAYDILVARHWVPVWTYLDSCCGKPSLVSALTERTFDDVLHRLAASGPLEAEAFPRLLLLRTARDIALDQLHIRHGTRLAQGFRHWAVNGSVRPMHLPARLTEAFAKTGLRHRIALWHRVVEHESRHAVSNVLGLSRDEAALVTAAARQALSQCYLDVFQRDTETLDPAHPATPHITHLITALAEDREGTRSPRTLDHLASCVWCTAGHDELAHLDTRLAQQVPQLLLGWWLPRPLPTRRVRARGALMLPASLRVLTSR